MHSASDIANMKHDQSLRILLTHYKCLIDEKCLSLKYMKLLLRHSCVWKFEIKSKKILFQRRLTNEENGDEITSKTVFE